MLLRVLNILQAPNWKYNNGFAEDTERDQRRKFRVEKKLQEMENIQEKMNIDPLQDNYHDILEFAENYFNSHERSPEGTLYYCYNSIIQIRFIIDLSGIIIVIY